LAGRKGSRQRIRRAPSHDSDDVHAARTRAARLPRSEHRCQLERAAGRRRPFFEHFYPFPKEEERHDEAVSD